MKKLWLSLFAFVLSVCCGFALLHGSYTRVNLIAHSNAYMSYDVNESDDSPYWEEYTMPTLHSYNYIVGADGVIYSFYVVTEPYEEEGETYYDYLLYVDIYDGTSVVNHLVDQDELDLGYTEGDLSDIFNLNNIYIYEDYIYIGNVQDFSYFVFDTSDFTINSMVANRLYYVTNSATFYYNTSGIDTLYFNGTQISVDGYDFDEGYIGSFICGDYYFCHAYDLNADDSFAFKFNSDGTYDVLNEYPMDYESNVWSDGKYAYYDNGSTHMIFDSDTNTWSSHVWTGYTGSFNASNIWSNGNDVYMTLANGTTYRLHIDRPYVSPYPNVLAEMIALMTSGIAGIAEGIGANLSVLAESVMIDATTGNLSAFGSLVVIMAGLALALHLCRWMVNFVSSLGRRDR